MDVLNRLQETFPEQVLKNQSLADYNSFKIGGPADLLFIPKNSYQLQEFIRLFHNADMPLTCLGLGSNTLIRDGGIEGVVVLTQMGLNAIEFSDTLLRVEAGVASAKAARMSARNGYMGLEFLAGIPGTIGGALAMNAGCFGDETWNHIDHVEMLDREGKIIKRQKSEFKIAYRQVQKPIDDELFLAANFHLNRGDKEKSLAIIRDLIAKRNETQPTGTANCGSVFRNPLHDFAGRIIESCGLKGMRIGNASVSVKHANFIVNEGKATAADIENLITKIKATVYAKTGVRLIPEVCIIGRS